MGKSRPGSFAYAQNDTMEAMLLNNCYSEPFAAAQDKLREESRLLSSAIPSDYVRRKRDREGL